MTSTQKRKYKVLFAEDDLFFSRLTAQHLESDGGFEVHSVYDGESAWELFKKQEFDICLLDIAMPKLDGIELGHRIRTMDKLVYICYLTGLNSMAVKKDMMEKGGADDYYIKPFPKEELVLKLKGCINRVSQKNEYHRIVYKIGNYTFDRDKLTLKIDGIPSGISHTESRILRMLIEHAGSTISRESIMQEVWGRDVGRVLDVHIARLRNRLNKDPRVIIQSRKNEGYSLWMPDRN
ncbi:response regulator transcription factor [Chitinophaga nivalis]|uniref:Response regulator transcription factor n=1 Tax=Chitinophaga nivalis TaxID=2991709 RepID=A0ABT3IUP3_9BACT|nr:response regulator transcription factor [Chitinophaga nivalis]MCW3462602.1 response regulator transcription factor [Chitinophaga nivalis]MCW3487707.1 response regulator transcription factor [Chitinophaga nivalis]